MHFTLNWRFLVKVAVTLVVAGVAVHFVHRWQVRKQVGVYLHHADAARDAGQREREIGFLRRYLMARPNDLDTRERLARAMCQAARTGRQRTEAYLVVEDVLRRDPARDDLRRFAIDFAMDPRIGLYTEARGHIDTLLQKRRDDGELEGLYALCLARQGKYKKEGDTDTDGAIEWYAKSILHRRDLIDSYAGRAAILRLHLDRPDDADKVVAAMLMVEDNQKNFRTHVVLAGYWRALNKPKQPAASVAKLVAEAQRADGKPLPPGATVNDAVALAVAEARKLGPQELDVILLAADVARARGRELAGERNKEESAKAVEEARQLLARGAELHPKAVAVHLAMAALEAETRSAADAVAAIRKGIDAAPDSAELVLALLDYQLQAGDAAGAGETLDRLKEGGLPSAVVDYEQARILALKEQWLDAALLLEQARLDVGNDPALARRINLLLGRSYAQVGENDRRLEAYTRAVPDDTADPLWVPALLGVAEAHAALGRADDALAVYRRLKAWVPVAQFEMLRALRAPAGKRDWTPVREAVAEAERMFKDTPPDRVPTDLHLVRIDLLNLEGTEVKASEARAELKKLRAARPKDVAVRIAIARQDVRDKNPKQAAATLDAAEKEIGDSVELRLARARLWAEEPDLPARLATLAAGAEKFSRGQQRQLLRELASVASAAGADDLAGRLWDQLAGVQQDDLGVHLVRFDRALRAGNVEAAQAIQAQVRRVDGEAGSFTRLTRAVLLIREAQTQTDKGRRDEAARRALELLDGLARERPRWGRVALGQALVHDILGDQTTALDKYRDAVDYGETNPDALRRLTELLFAKGRFADAEAALQKLEGAAASPEALRIAAEVHLRGANLKGAVDAAAKAVPADSKDPRDHLWLGQVYWAAGEKAKAEAPLRKAVELAPASADGWLILIRYLAATDRKDEATKTFEQAKDRVEMTGRSLFLALGYAQLGQGEKATEAFRRAGAERPDDIRTAQLEAQFFFETANLPAAREAFQRIIAMGSASPEEKDFARRMLALALAADRDYETSRKALEALGLVGDGAPRPAANETPAQRRSRAMVLALQRDRASKLEAIRLLEEDRGSITQTDQFLVARLHLAVGNRPQVRVTMTDLLRKPGADKVPLYLAFYAAWLLKEGDVREADERVKQLEKVQPDGLQAAELRARVLAARKDLPSARTLLLRKAEPAGAPVGPLARVCEDLGLHADAERLLRRFVEENKAARPQAPLALAAFYGRRGRTADALRVCEAVPASVPTPVVGNVAVNVLYADPKPDPAEVTKLGRWLEEAAAGAKGSTRAALVQQLASVRNLQGDYAAAADLYRRAVADDPKDALAMNNLAFLLSAREGKHDDALRLLDQAKRVLGPNPDLLDTEAIVRLKKGEVDAARKLLEEVLASAPSAAGYFHLAQVEHKDERRKLEARIAWRRATELELRRADLHPLEREDYDRLATLMK